MKILSKAFLMLLLISISFVGCKEDDPCENKVCSTFATCDEGTCVCNEGYEADAAGACVEKRQKYNGTYNATETCVNASTGNSVNASWVMTIRAGAAANKSEIILDNLGDYGEDVIGTLDGNNVTISLTGGTGGLSITGTGTFTGNVLAFTYVAAIPGVGSETCTGTATK